MPIKTPEQGRSRRRSDDRFRNIRSDAGKKRGPRDNDNCFIATAAFRSPMAQELNILRKWRDQELLSTYIGRAFVRIYYSISPPIANIIEKSDSIRSMVRFLLNPLIAIIKRKYK